MTLIEALDRLHEGMEFDYRNWSNPIRPYFVSGIMQTPYEAYQQLNTEYKKLVSQWIGHLPRRDEE